MIPGLTQVTETLKDAEHAAEKFGFWPIVIVVILVAVGLLFWKKIIPFFVAQIQQSHQLIEQQLKAAEERERASQQRDTAYLEALKNRDTMNQGLMQEMRELTVTMQHDHSRQIETLQGVIDQLQRRR